MFLASFDSSRGRGGGGGGWRSTQESRVIYFQSSIKGMIKAEHWGEQWRLCLKLLFWRMTYPL